jgi:hypothetical protein
MGLIGKLARPMFWFRLRHWPEWQRFRRKQRGRRLLGWAVRPCPLRPWTVLCPLAHSPGLGYTAEHTLERPVPLTWA